MMLHEMLAEIMRRLGDIGCAHVTIARGDNPPTDGRSRAFEVRFEPDENGEYLYDIRHWLGDQWSPWHHADGFHVSDVLATDWRFV